MAEFDDRLMTAERLLKLAGDHPLVVSPDPKAEPPLLPLLPLDCAECGRPVARLTDADGFSYRVTAGQLLQDVLRHLVMAHDVPLSGREKENG